MFEAAQRAGLNVILTPREPTAGALGSGIHKFKKATAVVYDLGGGAFDVSILKVTGNTSQVLGTGGIPKLGGRDFDDRIKDHVLDKFEKQFKYRPDLKKHAVFYQDLNNRAEQAKIKSESAQKTGTSDCNADVTEVTPEVTNHRQKPRINGKNWQDGKNKTDHPKLTKPHFSEKNEALSKAGDEIRTHDVQLGKLAFYH